MTIKIICAFLISLMSLAGCSPDKVSRQATPKLSGGHEDNAPSCPKLCSGDLKVISYYLESNTPSDPLQVCSPAADLHTTDDEEKEVKAEERDSGLYELATFSPTASPTASDDEENTRVYELAKSKFDLKDTTTLVALLFRTRPDPLEISAITNILLERLGCREEDILYTFYKDHTAFSLRFLLKMYATSPEEKQVMRRILNERGETIPET